jgi:magnesium and cobalt exporter, CNNM family
MNLWTQLLLLPVLIAANAFFVAAEYAVVSVRRPQIHVLESRGYTRSAGWLARLRGRMSSTLGGIQVCITMTNLLLGWLGEPAMTRIIHVLLSPLGYALPAAWEAGISVAIAFICVTLATVILSELLPKALTLQHTLFVGRMVALPLLTILWCIYPLVWLMDRLAHLTSRALGLGPVRIEDPPMGVEELKAVAQEAGDHGSLGLQEQKLILNTLGLAGMRADDVMVPRVHVSSLDLRRTMAQNREVMEEHLYSRLPLCNGGMDHIIGIVYTKEFLAAYPEASDSSILQLICRPAVFAPTTLSLDRLLALFLEKHSRMIVLVDEYGGVDGIVTLTDVMDQLLKGEVP